MPDTSRLTPKTSSLSGWRDPKNIRWSLRNFSILPSMMVSRGTDTHTIAKGRPHEVEDFTYEYLGKQVRLGDAMQQECVDGYIVIKDNEIIFEKYFDNFSDHDHHLWASMTKSLIATAFGIAAEAFDIDETKTPADYLPELADSAFSEVSIRQVLNMVTALNYTEEYEDMIPGSVHFEYFRRLGFFPDYDLMAIDPIQSDAPRGVHSMLPQFEKADSPAIGGEFQYQSPNVDVIGLLLERVTGQSVRDFIQKHIWGPLGTEHDGVFSVDVAFVPIATGGYNSTLRDAARFGLMALGDGKLGDTQIAPTAWMQDTYALTEADLAAGAASIVADPDNPRFVPGFQGYRSFWWNFNAAAGERMAMGVHGQVIYVNKARNLVIANFASPDQTANMLRASFKQLITGTRALAASL